MKLKAFFFEILPISVFFIISQYFSIITAALYASALSILVLTFFYFIEKRIAKFQIFSIFMSGVFSLIAFYFNEELSFLSWKLTNLLSQNSNRDVLQVFMRQTNPGAS